MLVDGQPVSGQEVVRRLQLDAQVVARVARVQEPRDDDHCGRTQPHSGQFVVFDEAATSVAAIDEVSRVSSCLG